MYGGLDNTHYMEDNFFKVHTVQSLFQWSIYSIHSLTIIKQTMELPSQDPVHP